MREDAPDPTDRAAARRALVRRLAWVAAAALGAGLGIAAAAFILKAMPR